MSRFSQQSPSNQINSEWLKRIFSWKIITGIITIIGFFIGINQFIREKGGDISVSLNGQEVFNNEKINNIIFVESQHTPIPDIFFPSLINNKEYSVRDFFLQYDILAYKVNISHSDFYNNYKSGDKTSLRYKDNVLYSFTAAESPISQITLNGTDGRLDVKMRATYDGISQPYAHEISTLFYVEPNASRLSFEQWKNRCKEKAVKLAKNSSINTYYISQGYYDSETISSPTTLNEQDSPKASSDDKLAENAPEVKQPEEKTENKEQAKSNIFDGRPIANAPIEITAIDTISDVYGTLWATVSFKRIETNTTAFITFDYTRPGHIPEKQRFYSVFNCKLYPGNTSCKVGLSEYHKYNENLRFVGFATIDPTLAECVDIERDNNITTLRNNSDNPIGIKYTTNTGASSGFTLNANATTSFKAQIADITYLRIPVIDWRDDNWYSFIYDEKGGLSGWGIALASIFTFITLLGGLAFIIYLSDRFKFFDDFGGFFFGMLICTALYLLYLLFT